MKRKLSKILGVALTLAMVVSILVVATPALALTQPQVSIPFGGTTIGGTTTYTITFTAGAKVQPNGDIEVTFPAGTTLPTGAGNVTIDALAGIGGGGGGPMAASAIVVSGAVGAPQKMVITLAGGQTIGQGSLVGVTIANVKNPATPGTYTLTVGTSSNATPSVPVEAAVTSSSYSIVPPTPTPLPGIVSAYNSAGILMQQSNSIQTCVDAAGPGGRVEVGPGYYDEDIVVDNTNDVRQTIVANGDPGTVIIKNAGAGGGTGTITINAAGSATLGGVTLDGFTFEMPLGPGSPATPVTVGATASYVKITNCTIKSGTTSAITLVAGSDETTISNCTIDATHATAARVGIIAPTEVTITGCTINVGAAATTQAIQTMGGTAAPFEGTTISNTTITGSSGLGIMVGGGVATLDGVTISTVSNALNIVAGRVTVKNSTIDGCGGPATAAASPITAANTTGDPIIQMYNNNIQNSTDYAPALAVTGNVTLTAHNNNFVNNKKQVTNTGGTVVITHNWWGANTGPAAGSVVGATASPYLTNSADSAGLALGTDKVATKTTVGIDVNCVDGTGTPVNVNTIAVSKYAANPEANAPVIMGTGSVIGYYDVLVTGAGGAAQVQIKIYGTVNNYCKLMYAGGLGGEWLDVNIGTGVNAGATGINTAGGYAYFIATGATQPSINDLAGTPFALVEDKSTPAGPSIAAAAGGSPVVGSYDVSTEPMFTWGAVPGSIRYEIALSEDPTFTIIEWSYNVDNTFYKVDEPLRYDTTYYWRVRGVLGEPYQQAGAWITPSTPWTVGIFTTEMEPEEAAEPIVVEPTKPEVNVEIPPTKITVEPSTPAIPTYMLWVIVAVGAVLVIALIVLIVRTRRVV